MRHFFDNVEGWFSDGDAELYKRVVKQNPSGSHFVEVGSYKGKSAAFMLVEIYNSRKDIKLDLIDNFSMSSVNELRTNLSKFSDRFNVIVKNSVEASLLYSDQTIDFLFIDADHDYESVRADIIAWLPKIKSGGILAGHDINHDPVRKAVKELLGFVNIIDNSWWIEIEQNKPKRKIIDCFSFMNEYDLLEARMEYLGDKVDYFVISEGNMTFSGDEKPLNLLANMSRYKDYAHKMMYFPYNAKNNVYKFLKPDETNLHDDPWKMHHDQLDHLSEGLRFFDNEDIAIVSDIDEIPSLSGIYTALAHLTKDNPFIGFKQDLFYYNFDYKQNSSWKGCILSTVSDAIKITPSWMRRNRWIYPFVEEGGWHLSYWMSPEDISLKLKSFAHQEFNKPENTNTDILRHRILQGIDPLGRDNQLVKVDRNTIPEEISRIFGKFEKNNNSS